MVNNDEKLLLDKDGYQSLLQEVETLKKQLAENGKEKGEAYSGAVGDGWHDNFAFDEANRQERKILKQLQECYEKLQRSVIVERCEDPSLIEVNDIVKINMIFGVDDVEEFQFKLIGSIVTNLETDLGLQCVSINSPLGNAVYHKHIGEKSSYQVEKRDFNIEIISKISEQEYVKKKGK